VSRAQNPIKRPVAGALQHIREDGRRSLNPGKQRGTGEGRRKLLARREEEAVRPTPSYVRGRSGAGRDWGMNEPAVCPALDGTGTGRQSRVFGRNQTVVLASWARWLWPFF
jgi:hypothetical protein